MTKEGGGGNQEYNVQEVGSSAPSPPSLLLSPGHQFFHCFEVKKTIKLILLMTSFLSIGVAGMMNWTVAIAPDVLKSRLQTCTYTTHFLTF